MMELKSLRPICPALMICRFYGGLTPDYSTIAYKHNIFLLFLARLSLGIQCGEKDRFTGLRIFVTIKPFMGVYFEDYLMAHFVII